MYFNCNCSYFFLLRFHQSADGCNKNTMERKKSVTHIHTLRFPSWPRFSAGIQRSTRDLAFLWCCSTFNSIFHRFTVFFLFPFHRCCRFLLYPVFFCSRCNEFSALYFCYHSITSIFPRRQLQTGFYHHPFFAQQLRSWSPKKKKGKRWQKQHTRPALDWRRVGNQLSHWVH